MTIDFINHKDAYVLIDEYYSEGQRQVIIQLPPFKNGTWNLTLYDGDVHNPDYDGDVLWSVKLVKIGDYIDLQYYKSFDESLVEVRFTEDGYVEFKSKYGRKLYYSADTIDEQVPPETYDNWQFEEYLYEANIGKSLGHIVTEKDSTESLTGEEWNGDASLYISSTDGNSVMYQPSGKNKTFSIYVPNQKVDKQSSVEFNQIKLPIPTGQVLFSENGILVGKDLQAEFATKSYVDDLDSKMDTRVYNLSTKETQDVNNLNQRLDNLPYLTEEAIDNKDKAVKAALKLDIDTLSDLVSETISDLNDLQDKEALDVSNLNKRIDELPYQKLIDDLTNKHNEEVRVLTNTINALTERVEVLEKKSIKFESPLKSSVNGDVTTVTLDESDICHLSKTETITGLKTVQGGMIFQNVAPVVPTSTPSNASTKGAIYCL